MAEKGLSIQLFLAIRARLETIPEEKRGNLKNWCRQAKLPYSKVLQLLKELRTIFLPEIDPEEKISDPLELISQIIAIAEKTNEDEKIAASVVPSEKLPELIKKYEAACQKRAAIYQAAEEYIRHLGIKPKNHQQIQAIIGRLTNFYQQQIIAASQNEIDSETAQKITETIIQETGVKKIILPAQAGKVITQIINRLSPEINQETVRLIGQKLAKNIALLPEHLQAETGQVVIQTEFQEALSQIAPGISLPEELSQDLVEIALHQRASDNLELVLKPTVILTLSASENAKVKEIAANNEAVNQLVATLAVAVEKIPEEKLPPAPVLREQAQAIIKEKVSAYVRRQVGILPKNIRPSETTQEALTELTTHYFARRASPLAQIFFQQSLLPEAQNKIEPANFWFHVKPLTPNKKLTKFGQTETLIQSSRFWQLEENIARGELVRNWLNTIVHQDYRDFPKTSQIFHQLCAFQADTFSEDGLSGLIKEEISPGYYVISPAIQEIQQRAESWLVQKITQTQFGKAIKKGGQKIAEKFAKWSAEKLAKKGIELGGKKLLEILVKEGAQAALATAFNIPGWAIWLIVKGTQLAWGALKWLSEKIGLSKTIHKTADFFSFGLAKNVRDLIAKVPVLNWFKDILGFTSDFIISLTVAGSTVAISAILLPVFIITFGSLLFFNWRNQQMALTLAPPVGQGDEMGIPESEMEEIFPFETDVSYCQKLSGSAQLACVLKFVIADCPNINGAVTSSNMRFLESCLLASETLKQFANETRVGQMAQTMKNSARKFTYLQCVGFKRAVEPNLPGCGDAKDFSPDGCGRCRQISMDEVQTGDNAVWTGGAYGHIAIVIGFPENDPDKVITAQAWGDSGRINFRSFTKASAIYIRCR